MRNLLKIRRMIINEKVRNKTRLRCQTDLGLTSWVKAVHYLTSSACSGGLGSALFLGRWAASLGYLWIFTLRSPIGVLSNCVQFYIASLVVKGKPKHWLPEIFYLLLIEPDNIDFNKVQDQLFLWCLFQHMKAPCSRSEEERQS